MKVIRIISSEIFTNSYLILTENPILIDSGTLADKVLRVLEKHIELIELKYVILTHYHFDHVEAAPIIRKKTGAEILIHELDKKFIDFEVDGYLKDRGVVKLDDHEFKIIHTPGHTPGSVCLFEKESRSLFSGDTVFPGGGFGRTDLPGGDQESMITSLEKLSKLNVEILYPGHGNIVKRNVNKQIRLSFQNALLSSKI